MIDNKSQESPADTVSSFTDFPDQSPVGFELTTGPHQSAIKCVWVSLSGGSCGHG